MRLRAAQQLGRCTHCAKLAQRAHPALLQHANDHLKDVMVAALETGMRKGEILSLQWKQVRLLQNDLYLPGAKTKARRDRKLPISPTLRDVLTRRQHGMTEGPNPQRFKFGPDHYVFGDEAGAKIADVKTAWENAVLKAHGVKPARMHAVSAFLGHANVTTTARYLNVKDDYLQELIERKPLTLVK
jgi:integrase